MTGVKSPLIEMRNGVMWIIVNSPELRNALTADVFYGMIEGIHQAEGNSECRAIVFTGAGDDAFSAGANLRPGTKGSAFDVDPARPGHPGFHLFRALENCDLPTIARVNGDAIAGALALIAGCDLAVASSKARFGSPEVRIGLFPINVIPYLMRSLGKKRLMEVCLTGDLLTADEALAAGLLNYVVPHEELDAKVEWLLKRVITRSPSGIRVGKHAYHAMQDMTLPQAFAHAEAVFPLLTMTEDTKEGIAAFNEKRKPVWKNR